MSAKFREVFGNSGVDKGGMMVPLNGSNLVALVDGKNLKVFASSPGIKITEIAPHKLRAILSENDLLAKTDTNTLPLPNDARIFVVTGTSLMGYRGATITAKGASARDADINLPVVILGKKTVKISIRPVQIRGDDGQAVFHSKKLFDTQTLKDQMDIIWKPQANIVFELVSTDSVMIDDQRRIAQALGLNTLDAAPLPDGVDLAHLKSIFVEKKDPKADITFFLVKRVIDRTTATAGGGAKDVEGLSDSSVGIALIGDSRTTSTMAHEAGHIIGKIDHLETDGVNLMQNFGPGHGSGKLYVTDVVHFFNKP
jgi:hypothetical protein